VSTALVDTATPRPDLSKRLEPTGASCNSAKQCYTLDVSAWLSRGGLGNCGVSLRGHTAWLKRAQPQPLRIGFRHQHLVEMGVGGRGAVLPASALRNGGAHPVGELRGSRQDQL
jgi:hypothetical protein